MVVLIDERIARIFFRPRDMLAVGLEMMIRIFPLKALRGTESIYSCSKPSFSNK